jgi:hypothetical protein
MAENKNGLRILPVLLGSDHINIAFKFRITRLGNISYISSTFPVSTSATSAAALLIPFPFSSS